MEKSYDSHTTGNLEIMQAQIQWLIRTIFRRGSIWSLFERHGRMH